MNRRTFVKSLSVVATLPFSCGIVTSEGKLGELVDDGRKFCPTCREQGLKSSVYMLSCQTTLLAGYAYWDENGTYHYHNPNKTTCHYRCSNGHEWSE